MCNKVLNLGSSLNAHRFAHEAKSTYSAMSAKKGLEDDALLTKQFGNLRPMPIFD